MVPGGGCRKGITLQGILTPTGVIPNGHSCLRRKGGIMGASDHAPRQRNIMYVQMVRRSIYNTRRPEHPQSPIRRYKGHSLGPSSQPCYTYPVPSPLRPFSGPLSAICSAYFQWLMPIFCGRVPNIPLPGWLHINGRIT